MLEAAPARSVINLNVPARRRHELAGIRWARLAPFGAARAAIAEATGDGVLQMELRAVHEELPPDCDTALCREGFASLTTLVGVAEAWPVHLPEVEVEAVAVPGGPVHPVHALPDPAHDAVLRSRLWHHDD